MTALSSEQRTQGPANVPDVLGVGVRARRGEDCCSSAAEDWAVHFVGEWKNASPDLSQAEHVSAHRVCNLSKSADVYAACLSTEGMRGSYGLRSTQDLGLVTGRLVSKRGRHRRHF